MDVLERLTIERAAADDLLALTHVQRYAIAAELCADLRIADVCCGSGYGSAILADSGRAVLGVDRDGPSIEHAARVFADVEGLEFERADAHEFLEGELGSRFDAIVILEGLEHLDDLRRALAALRRHGAAGMRLIVSLPNGKPFGEHNPHHVTEFDHASATDAFGGFDRVAFVYQYQAEGSLIASAEGREVLARLALTGRAEPQWCNHVIALVNFDLEPSTWARMRLDVAPLPSRYIVELERANRDLRNTNTRLLRDRLGVADSAAAARLTAEQEREEMFNRLASRIGGAIVYPMRFCWAVGASVVAHLPEPLQRLIRRLLGRS